MLSIIICSKNKEISSAFSQNIEETVGVEFELIVIDNSANTHSIFSAYNFGAQQSTFPFLCFVHDDVLFKTNNWGTLVCEHLSDKTVGLIGLAGGDLVTRVPMSWSAAGIAKNFIQSAKDGSNPTHSFAKPASSGNTVDVALLDGMFLAMRKELFVQLQFDTTTFQGFHGYDIDICLQSIAMGFRNIVIYDVLIEHFSAGFRSKDWVENILKMKQKWSASLPINVGGYSQTHILHVEQKSLIRLIRLMVRLGYGVSEILLKTDNHRSEVFPQKSTAFFLSKIYWMKCMNLFKLL